MYNESMNYDKNGNITNLYRNGGQDLPINQPIEIDNLTYKYDIQNNQLRGVHDNSNSLQGFKDKTGSTLNDVDYTYDANGNMITDTNKGITSIKYNHLNLPTEIIFNNSNSKKITYLYNSLGIKLQKVVTNGASVVTTDYLDGFQHKDAVLQFFPHAEGYVTNTQTIKSDGLKRDNFNYVYNYLDHLGNIRLSYAWDYDLNVLKTIEENNYYPFGLKHTNYNSDLNAHKAVQNETKVELKAIPDGGETAVVTPVYNYKYQSQERQSELGLNWDSYKYRNYDYAIGRFMSIDPLTEDYDTWSPYVFSGNRVIDSRELEGLEPVSTNRNNDVDTGSFRYKVAEFLTNMVMTIGDIGAASNGKTANTAEEKVSNIKDGMLFIIDNSLFLEGVTSINRAPSDGELSPSYAKGVTEVATKAETGVAAGYSNLKDSKSVGPGKPFTSTQKAKIINENMKKNGGVIKSDLSGKVLDKAVQSKKGEKANMNQAEIDHVDAKSKGGSNSYKNAQVLSKEENLKKSNN